MSESLVFLSKSLIGSFFLKKQAIHSENHCANSQPWIQEVSGKNQGGGVDAPSEKEVPDVVSDLWQVATDPNGLCSGEKVLE